MSPPPNKSHFSTRNPKYRSPEEASRIYLFPNLFTAGNMLCGFLSIRSCILAKYTVAGDIARANALYQWAVYFILGACIFDLFDGRVARAFKRESLFGAEFDSIADTVSFGMAPAIMVFFLILNPNPDADLGWIGNLGKEFGWLFAFIYLLCVGIRLARFNVLTNPLVPGYEKSKSSDEFIGLPSPWAAGMVASLVLLLTHADPTEATLRKLTTLLLPLILLISYLMVSNIRYPSFKHINWNTRLKSHVFILVLILLLLSINYFNYIIPCIFLAFILNGLFYTARKKYARKKNLGGTGAIENNPEDEF